MFSTLWNSRQTQSATESSEVEQQILSELATATETETGMVSTRSQEPGLIVDFEELLARGTPNLRNKKRKTSSQSSTDTDDSRPLKRGKESATDRSISLVRGNIKPLIPVVPPSINDGSIPNDGIEVRITNVGRPEMPEWNISSENGTVACGHPNQQENKHITSKSPDISISRQSKAKLSLPTDSSEPSKVPYAKSSQTTWKAKHKRFGSEDALEKPLLASENNIVPEVDSKMSVSIQMDVESEDGAPETISASTGLRLARSAASGIAKVAKMYVNLLETCFSVSISDTL